MRSTPSHFLLKIIPALLFGTSVCVAQQAEPRTEIGDIEITIDGNTSSQEILNQMATMETPWDLWIFLNENIYEKIGAPREYFEPNIFYQDIVHLKEYLRDNGYFRSTIDTSLIFSDDRKYVDIIISINENVRSTIDTVKILGLDDIAPDVWHDIKQKSVLNPGDPYINKNVVVEQSRILRTLVNAGYPKVFLDSVGLFHYASTNNFSITLIFNPGNRFLFGDVSFDHVDPQIDSSVMLRQLDFETGQIYSEEKRVVSEQNLNRLGVFEFANVRAQSLYIGGDQTVIPLIISFRTLELQEITPEFLVLNENSTLFSTGLGLSYKHRNLLGGAQNFSISSRVRANEIQDLNYTGAFSRGLTEPTLFGKVDFQSQLVFPYFLSNKTSASITLTAEAEKQREYDLTTLRAKIGFSTQLATYTLGITEFNIERIDPYTKKENVLGIRVEDQTRQFNFIESFTLQRDKTNNFFSPTSGFFHSATIEEAGIVSKTAGGFQLPYSEYYKVSALVKHYFSGELSQTEVFAVKLKSGFAQLYNPQNTTPVPLPRRFFTGGSSSVRAWKDKQLSAFADTITGGNIGIEGSIETRIQLFPNGGKIFVLELPRFWSVVFLDFGNTWEKSADVMLNEFGLAVGFGLRYETFVGPFRFDLAFRLYDPKKPEGQQWLYEQQFFKNSFSIVHFGIGHAF